MTRKGPKRDMEKERRWRRLIGEAARSGQSIREFCRRKRLEECQFYAWRRELRVRGRGKAERGDMASFALVSAEGDGEAAGIELAGSGSEYQEEVNREKETFFEGIIHPSHAKWV
jgi:transposase-like protein